MSEQPTIGVLVAPGAPDPPGLDALDGSVEVVRTADELDAALERIRALAVYDFRTPLLSDLGDRAGRLEWIHAASAGVDAVLTPAVAASDTVVTNARGVFDRPIAEYVVGLLIAFAKDLLGTLELQRRREWRHRETLPVAGRRVVVVGAGSIGSTVARLAGACGMRVTGIARTARDDPDYEAVLASDGLLEALALADDVVVTAPHTPETHHLIGTDAFAAMRGVHLVNVGRGPVVDTDALMEAIGRGSVRAAGLDVFEEEPLPVDHPLWAMPEVVISPHMSGDEEGWEARLTEQLGRNLARWSRGDVLENVVDKQRAAAAAGAS